MKRILSALASIALLVAPMGAERVNSQVTITAGTPIRIATQKTMENRILIQSRHSNSGIIYVLMGVNPNKACNASDTSQLTAELGPGDSLHPGASLSDPQGASGNTISDAEDVSWMCLDGTNSSDVAIVSYWRRN